LLKNLPTLSAGLRENVLSILSGTVSNGQLNTLIRTCHSLAFAFLARKKAAGLLQDFHGLNVSDLAYDSIAELFERDGSGRLVLLDAYFSALPVTEASDEIGRASCRERVY
jgi:hypothetical protein